MKMYFYRGPVLNFGDELNTWLLPKIFPDFFDEDESRVFLGIGSIIFDFHPARSDKIVFGSGYGGYTKIPDFDDTWKFYSVRGPRTAAACGIDQTLVAADSAVLINKFRSDNKSKKFPVSFMPHWGSLARGQWRLACQLAGINYVDPAWPVEDVIAAIESSDMVIAEAMHFAIVSDALRVPWVSALPIHRSHRMKWYDWAEALNVELRQHKLFPSSTREACVAAVARGRGEFFEKFPGIIKAGIAVADKQFVKAAAKRLTELAKMEPNLSKDSALAVAIEKLEESAARIKRDYAVS